MLKKDVLDSIKKNKQLRLKLCEINKISETTLLKWLREANENLTLAKNIDLIASYLNNKKIMEENK